MFCSNCELSIILPHKYHCICEKGKFSPLYNHSSGRSAGKYCTMANGPFHQISAPPKVEVRGNPRKRKGWGLVLCALIKSLVSRTECYFW